MCSNVENNQKTSSSSASAFAFSLFLFSVLFAVGTAADLLTKNVAFQALGMPGEYRPEQQELESIYYIWNGVFGFQTSLNTGAVFGLGHGQVHLLAVLSCVFLAGIICYVFIFAWKSRFLTVILALISAGIVGNLYDRLALHGISVNGQPYYAVRDWILVLFGSYHYPNFNVADSMLVCSAVLLVVYSLWFDKKV